MSNFELAKIVSIHASVVLTEEVIAHLERILVETGWELSSIDVVTTDGREAKCDSLTDLCALPASLWDKASGLTVWARVPGQGFTNLSCIAFKKPRWYGFEKPVTIYIRSTNEDLGVPFEARLTSYVHSISKWYSQLSRGLWWNLLMYTSAWMNEIIVLVFKLFGAEPPVYSYNWLLPIILFLVFGAMTYGGRQRLFPAVVFAIHDSRLAKEK